jgi:hypothetical protein
MEAAAAIGIASNGSLIRLAAVMPIKADKVLPAITAHGWAIGLPGKANTKRALAPREAINHSSSPLISPRYLAIVSTNINPTNVPQLERKRSVQVTAG